MSGVGAPTWRDSDQWNSSHLSQFNRYIEEEWIPSIQRYDGLHEWGSGDVHKWYCQNISSAKNNNILKIILDSNL